MQKARFEWVMPENSYFKYPWSHWHWQIGRTVCCDILLWKIIWTIWCFPLQNFIFEEALTHIKCTAMPLNSLVFQSTCESFQIRYIKFIYIQWVLKYKPSNLNIDENISLSKSQKCWAAMKALNSALRSHWDYEYDSIFK